MQNNEVTLFGISPVRVLGLTNESSFPILFYKLVQNFSIYLKFSFANIHFINH